MGCCGPDSEEGKEGGMVIKRRCRDVLCLLIFIAFWCGMIVIAAVAYQEGDTNRLVYGVDSLGMTCGSNHTFMGQAFDLKSQSNLYYLNPLELLDIFNIPFARKICVETCPSQPHTCEVGVFPCPDDLAYRCPYYAVAQQNLYDHLQGVNYTSTQYYAELATAPSSVDAAASQFVTAAQSLNIPWVNSYLSSHGITPSSSVGGAYYQFTSQFPGKGPCYPVWVPTTSYFNRCVPKFPANFTSKVIRFKAAVASALPEDAQEAFKTQWQSLSARLSRYTSDIQKGALIIVVGGLVTSLGMSLIYMLILRYFAGFMVWCTVLLVNLALLAITLYCFSLAGLLGSSTWAESLKAELGSFGNPTAVDENTWMWIAITAAVVAGLVLILTLLMFSRIRIAVACIKVASQAVGTMPSILLFPLVPFVLECFLIVFWVAVSAMMYTAGDLKATCRNPSSHKPINFRNFSNLDPALLAPNISAASLFDTSYVDCYTNYTGDNLTSLCFQDPNCFIGYKWNNKIRYAFLYHLFGLLWTNQFIVGISCVTISGAIGSYYWAGGVRERMPSSPVARSSWNTFVYSLGSIAFAAVVIAVIQFLRILLEFLDRKTKQIQEANKCAAWAMCCCKCCMWCLEKIVAFINRNAYIMMAIKGVGYCEGAFKALKLIVSNALRLTAVNVIGDMLLFLGKLAVAATCGVIAFFLCRLPYYSSPLKYPTTYLSSPFFPVLLSVMCGFVIAQIFFSVYEMAIDTIILCFCEDCEGNSGNPKYAPPLLMEAMGQEPGKAPPPPQQQQQASKASPPMPQRHQQLPPIKGNAVAPEPPKQKK